MKLIALLLVSSLLALPSLAQPQAPRYHAEFLGTFHPGRISESGEIIGTTTVSGNQRGYVTSSGRPLLLLPLPAGMLSSGAVDVNQQGVIVGAVSPSSTPEFGGRAVVWDPDGAGGYGVRLLGELPGHVLSRATAVNGAGDVVGYSSDGTYRYPVLFTAPGGILDLTSTGVFDPVDINDHRVLVDRSFTVKRLDLNTMIVEDLGTPPGSYLATSAAAINEAGQVGGNAILASGGDCDRVAARYTDGVGWQVLSGCGRGNGISDMNEQGDTVMHLNVAPYVRFEGQGTYLIEDLIVNDIGHWYVSNYSGVTINSARWMAVFATNQVTGQSGALLLTPESSADVDLPVTTLSPGTPVLSIEPNPFGQMARIGFELPRGARVSLVVLDAAGRVVRRVADGEMRAAGSHRLQWDGRDEGGRELASGVYRLRLDADGAVRIGRVVLLR